MSREDPQMKIRLTLDLKERIEAAAKTAGRSLNSEIIARLQQSFDAPPGDEELREKLAITAKALKLCEESMLIMHGLLRATLKELPPDLDHSLSVQFLRLFVQASDDQDLEKAKQAWDALLDCGDPTVLLSSQSGN